MSGSCLMAGAVALAVTHGFTLSWTHSVERTGWREDWVVESGRLHLIRAQVRGSGAGMEPGPDAVLHDEWWVWSPHLRVPRIDLAASGATGAGWRLCTDSGCRELGAQAGDAITLSPCAAGVTGD